MPWDAVAGAQGPLTAPSLPSARLSRLSWLLLLLLLLHLLLLLLLPSYSSLFLSSSRFYSLRPAVYSAS